MTNLSKELCEICGIEPVIEDRCKISDRYWKNSHKIKEIHDIYVQRYCPYNMECTSKCKYSYVKQIYPDFEQPTNFVKLLKIANDVLGSVHFATAYTKNKPGIFEEQVLLHYLPIAKLNEGFKRAIRAEEWKYEIHS